MANLKTLSEEMAKMQRQIETVLAVSHYREYDDLSGLDDYKQIKTADQRQQLEEYRNVLYRLDEVQSTLAYFERPVREVSRIHQNGAGRYETDSGYCYTSGSDIEFLRTEEDAEIWTYSRVESKGEEYYIVGYPDIELSGLTVRVRG